MADENGGGGAGTGGGDLALRTLQRRVEELTAENARRKNTTRALQQALGVRSKADAEALIAEVREHGGDFRRVLSEYKTLKASPDEARQQLEAARGELRSYKHRDGFRRLYEDRDLGLNPAVPVERLQAIMGYRADSDEFDAASARRAVEALKQSDPYLFVQGQGQQHQAQNGQQGGQQGGQQQAPAWGGRGQGLGSAGGPAELTEAQLRDPAYMIAGPGAQAAAR